VKSPPELWAELSSPEALTRHLGDFGEIRITSVEPETKVEWEAEGASGIVHLKQSGWGTKVTLSVTRSPSIGQEPSEPATEGSSEPEGEPFEGHDESHEPTATADGETSIDPESTVEVEPAPNPEPESVATVEPVPEPVARVPELREQPNAVVELEEKDEPESAVAAEPEPRLGFFARIFRKRRTKPVTIVVESEPEPVATVELDIEPEAEPDPEPACPRTGEVVALAAPWPIYPTPPLAPVADLAAELASVEAQMAEETTELLTGVLDRLGAAHHRPFSRG
jgi:hypothetical protein